MTNLPRNMFCGRTRREFLHQLGCGFGALPLLDLLHKDAPRTTLPLDGGNPMAPRKPPKKSLLKAHRLFWVPCSRQPCRPSVRSRDKRANPSLLSQLMPVWRRVAFIC